MEEKVKKITKREMYGQLLELEEVKAEKARLDGEIKKYRSEGNMDMVNSLRKQRRIVRGKINKLK